LSGLFSKFSDSNVFVKMSGLIKKVSEIFDFLSEILKKVSGFFGILSGLFKKLSGVEFLSRTSLIVGISYKTSGFPRE